MYDRPAAIEQLHLVGKRVGVEVFDLGTEAKPVDIAQQGLEKAKKEEFDTIIVDTAGRLQVPINTETMIPSWRFDCVVVHLNFLFKKSANIGVVEDFISLPDMRGLASMEAERGYAAILMPGNVLITCRDKEI